MEEVPDYPLERIFSIDVECVAVGRTHELTSRAPCSVALVDGRGEVLYSTAMRPDVPIVSYLTPITGMTARDLEAGVSFGTAVTEVRRRLPKDAVLVGQKLDSDIAWLQLIPGEDFAVSIDIAEIFRGFNQRYGNFVFHSLQHEAQVLLGKSPPQDAHDPAWDAQASVELYIKAKGASPGDLDEMRQLLIRIRPTPSIAKRYNYVLDGVCMAKFMPKLCVCGAPCA
uniref:Exonuclease domain-containing protein n=1 Tax=Alexandrium andersonii TaxID=327968 RepID=A0A7S2AX29_9DINO